MSGDEAAGESLTRVHKCFLRLVHIVHQAQEAFCDCVARPTAYSRVQALRTTPCTARSVGRPTARVECSDASDGQPSMAGSREAGGRINLNANSAGELRRTPA